MNFSWSAEQLQYKRAVIDFAKRELSSELIEHDKNAEFSRDSWEKCARETLKVLEEAGSK